MSSGRESKDVGQLAAWFSDLTSRIEALEDLAKRGSLTFAKPTPAEYERLHHYSSAVALEYGLHVDDLLGVSRDAGVCRARHEAWKLAHESGMTMAAIARAAARDHSTVRHGISCAQRDTMTFGYDE